MLWRDHLEQPQSTVCPAISTLFHPTPRGLRHGMRVDHFVNHHRSGVNSFSQVASATDVAREHCRGQAIDTVVRQLHGLVVRLKRHDREDWTKRFFRHYRHRMIHIRHDRRLAKPPTAPIDEAATRFQSRAFLNSVAYMTLDDHQLSLMLHRYD